jgi:mediator of RNA polymerase II transcription subunit 10
MYNIMVQTTAYDASASSSGGSGSTATPSSSNSTATPPTTTTTSASSSSRASRDVLAAELRALQQTLQAIHRASTPAKNPNLPHVPPELIQYVENGRNPDIYTREFVELVRRGNQLMRGKQDAFRAFRDVLAGEVAKAMPELREDVRRVVAATDGAAEPPAGAVAAKSDAV